VLIALYSRGHPSVIRRAAVNLRPLGDRVVVKPVEREEKTKSGIVIPDTAKEKPQEGIVEAVGTGRILDSGKKVPMELKVGDKVLYAKYAGTEFKPDDVEYMIISEKDVLAVIASPSKSNQRRSKTNKKSGG
jgi:chaperonin GroES